MPRTERPVRAPRGRGRRLWRIPPALPREPEDRNLDALPVLTENTGDGGVLLWLAVRDVILWASTPPERRARLFAPGAAQRRREMADGTELAPELDWSLRSLNRVVIDPGDADPESVCLSCVHISHWADGRGAGGTALWFAQAAVLVDPTSAQLAVDVGRLAGRLGRPFQAETWLRRSIAIARRSGEWRVYAIAFVGLGDILLARGDRDKARLAYMRAVRVARRNGLAEEQRYARIGLMSLALHEGDYLEAAVLATHIRRAWNSDDPEYPTFALNSAELKLREGGAAEAASILKALILRPLEPLQRLRTASLLAHAAACTGEKPTMVAAWDETERLIRGRGEDRASAVALLDLSRAAEAAGFHRKAVELAARAEEIAIEHADPGVANAARVIAGGNTAPHGS
jgi:tetratricopeptide (TPR) repeat protein